MSFSQDHDNDHDMDEDDPDADNASMSSAGGGGGGDEPSSCSSPKSGAASKASKAPRNSNTSSSSHRPPKASTDILTKLAEMAMPADAAAAAAACNYTSEQRRDFYDKLARVWDDYAVQCRFMPTISKHTIDLCKLYYLVKERGGFNEVRPNPTHQISTHRTE